MNMLTMLITCVPYIKKMIKEDIMIGITDTEKFLYYEPSSRVDFGIKSGDPIPPEDDNLRSALAGQFSSTNLPASIYGFSISAMAIPVKDENGTIIGSIATAQTNENQEMLEEYIHNLDRITNQLVDMVQNVAAHSEQLSATSEHVLTNTKNAVQNSSSINKTVGFINEISSQTNLLGLNASIEAARVGEMGAGFGVVAKEVRKLSVDTKNATQQISSALNGVQQSIQQLDLDFSQIAASSREQAILVTDFMNVIEGLSQTTKEMKIFIEGLLKHSDKIG